MSTDEYARLQRECTMRRDMHIEACKKIDALDAIIANVRELLTTIPPNYDDAREVDDWWLRAIRKALGE